MRPAIVSELLVDLPLTADRQVCHSEQVLVQILKTGGKRESVVCGSEPFLDPDPGQIGLHGERKI